MNVFDLQAILTLDKSDYEKSLSDAKDDAKKANDDIKDEGDKGNNMLSKLGSGLGKGVAVAGAATAAAVGAAAAGVASLAKNAVEAYANYEQLSGGVETLFKAGSTTVMENASKAFQTAGMSANEYMETATGFAASLISSLGGDTEKAANYADQAISDMSDNANKMGTDIESIKTAYSGFAKQNYTMLDNLKLGYGGTKEEMQRLLDDANEYNRQQGINTNYQLDSYADIVDAIHTVQDNMGITGATADEAMTTIEGAANATKSAWQNVVTAIAGGGDLDEAISGLTTSIFGDGTEGTGLLANLIPRIKQAIEGIGEFIGKAAPYIEQNLPQLIQDLVPPLLQAAWSLAVALGKGLIAAIPAVIDMLKQLLVAVFTPVVNAVAKLWDDVKTAITTKIDNIKKGIVDKFNSVKTFIQNIINKIKGVFNFTWSLPHIKLPHFSIQPSGWSLGDLLKGSIPSLGIEWYAKAMNGGMILDSPTIFGASNGRLLGAGEAGSEVVVGQNSLLSMIRSSVEEVGDSGNIYNLLLEYLPTIANLKIYLDGKALVGGIKTDMSKALTDEVKKDKAVFA